MITLVIEVFRGNFPLQKKSIGSYEGWLVDQGNITSAARCLSSSRSLRATAAARLPPALSPATIIRLVSIPYFAPVASRVLTTA